MIRKNLTKKDLINSIYMQIGFSKNVSENLLEDLLFTIIEGLKNEKKLKLSKFGTFLVRAKKKESVEILKQKKLKLYQVEMLFYLKLQRNLKL